MAATGTPTSNIGLRIMNGTDPVDVADINANSQTLDGKIGAVPNNKSLQQEITENASAIASTNTEVEHFEKGVAILIDGNKAKAAGAIGDYVLLVNSTISGRNDGCYIAAKAFSNNDTLDASYFTESSPFSKGGLNVLNGKKTFGMNKITASSLADFQNKLTALAGTMNDETSTELVVVAPTAFGIFKSGTHSFTFHKLATNYYWGYGFMQSDLITFSNGGGTWSYEKMAMNKQLEIKSVEITPVATAAGSYTRYVESSVKGKPIVGYGFFGVAASSVAITQLTCDTTEGIVIIFKNNGSQSITPGSIIVYYLDI